MGKKDNGAAARIARTEVYAENVRRLFASAVNGILGMKKTLPVLEEGVMYSFDGETVRMRREVESMLARLHSSVTLAVRNGIETEWETANAECDGLIRRCFGKKLAGGEMFASWVEHNGGAMRAFMERTDCGLNLSERVWQSVRQLREEMEIAMTVGIGEGRSAAEMSRTVRQCLNDPDLMFRRFRYKDENGEWQRKWKKRVIDAETGKARWTDYERDDYRTGRGVYKSSAKNAMRVARTETNMAYREADYQRWQQLDFVLGIEIKLSGQHPVKDICDSVQGKYPKDFKFLGWHPQCFCIATPILASVEEMNKTTEAFLRGEKYVPQGDVVTDVPDGFRKWVADNGERMRRAKSLPYWVRDNGKYVDILNSDADLPKLINVTPIDTDVVPNMKYTSTPTRKMTWCDKVDNAIRSAIYYEGEDCDVAKWYVSQIGTITDKTRAQYVIKRINEQIGKYSVVELPTIEHLMTLRTADVLSIHPAWRARYNEIVKILNAHDYSTGIKPIVRDIEEAHNILQLSTNPNAIKYGLDKLSHRTPYQIFDAFEKKIPGFSASCPRKEFFDAFPEYVPLFTSGNGAYFLPSRKHVVIALNDSGNIDRLTNSLWYRKGLFTHEYGHAYDKLTGQRNDPALKKIFDEWRTEIKKDNGIALESAIVNALKPHRDAFDAWWETSEIKRKADEAVASATTWKDKKKAIDERWKLRGIEYSKQLCDIEEQIGGLSDCLGAALNGKRFITPRGHTGSYFAFSDKQLAEFIAHCSENYWSGNIQFKALAPQLYEAMRKYIENKLPKSK